MSAAIRQIPDEHAQIFECVKCHEELAFGNRTDSATVIQALEAHKCDERQQ